MKKSLKTFLRVSCLLLALCITVCAIPLSATAEGDSAPDTVKVLVAKKNIMKGKMVTPESVELITVKNENLPTNYMSDPAKVVGKYAKADIYDGEYIFFDLLSSEKVHSTNSDVLVKPIAQSEDKYLVVTDYVMPDTGKDLTGALQDIIDKNPRRTIYFPDGVYLISSPLYTSAKGTHSVSLQFSDGAVLKADKTWKSGRMDNDIINSLICSGGSAHMNDIVTVGSYYSIKGGTLDGSGKADGIKLVSGRETLVRNICMRNVKKGIIVGEGANNGSSDMDFEDITIYGTGKTDSTGIVITGLDNTFSNIRIYNVHTGIKENSGGNLFKNIYVSNRDIDNLQVYASTVAFSMRSPWMSQCYAENFSTAYSVSSGAELWDCTAKWTSERCTRQVAVSAATPPPALSGIRAEFYPGVEDTHMFIFSGASMLPTVEGCMYDSELCNNGFDSGYLITPVIPHKSK